ncbi:hypothetical protein HYY75_05830, partial [bacterium]|nr:hypothetical protein [bacterium]
SSGAIFRIVCLENGERRIDVSNGKTQLITPGQTVVLSALQTVSISSDGKISPIEDFDPSSDPEMKASFQK